MSITARFNSQRGEFTLAAELEIPSTGVTAIFGASGSGKTSLLRAIAGLDKIENGCLRIGNQLWQDSHTFVPPHRRSLSYVFQEASLFGHLNVQQNIEYGAKRAKSVDNKLLDKAIALLGLDRMLDRKPSTLSGGERQRVAIARALASGPQLLLMDEPLASLDQARKQEILPLIQNVHRSLNIPVIYVSHCADEVAQLADHLVLLSAGQVMSSGAIQTMLTSLEHPLAHQDDAEAIIETTVAEHDSAYHLTYLEFSGGRFAVNSIDQTIGSAVRLRIAARDVSLTLTQHSETSILNIFPATIDAISAEDSSQMTVRVLVGGVPLLARLTKKSVVSLGLDVGKSVYAQAKSAAVLI
ncbi:MAG: molybdate transport system ATP-binding protein [Arenicella sp.]|jgi:molybdate transport system ATP-binding protein